VFESGLAGRERTDLMVRFRFRRSAVDEDQVRSLADREQACCPFFDIRLTAVGDELWWETRVADNPDATSMLDEFFRLPDHVTQIAATIDNLTHRNRLITH
jgi:hypothetical protein